VEAETRRRDGFVTDERIVGALQEQLALALCAGLCEVGAEHLFQAPEEREEIEADFFAQGPPARRLRLPRPLTISAKAG
jgi:hypothetical protein